MPHSDSPMVLLGAEDEPLVRMFLADALDEARFRVFEAVNADEAITLPVVRQRATPRVIGAVPNAAQTR